MADDLVARDTGGSYEKPPADGYSAVAVDVIDLGYHYNRTYDKVEHKIAIVFQLDALNTAGKRFEIANRLTFTFGEKSNLRKFLGTWRGKTYNDDEAREGAPLRKLVGQPAYITIEHKVSGDKTYANIVGITKLPKGLTPIKPDGYTRSEHWKMQSSAEADSQRYSTTIPGTPTNGDAPRNTVAGALVPAGAFDDFPAALEDADDDLPFR